MIGCLDLSSVAENLDFSVSSNEVIIPAYHTNAHLPVNILRDTSCEDPEIFKATLSTPPTQAVAVEIQSNPVYVTIIDTTGKSAANSVYVQTSCIHHHEKHYW